MNNEEFRKLHNRVFDEYFISEKFKRDHPRLFKMYAENKKRKNIKIKPLTPEETKEYRKEVLRRIGGWQVLFM